MPGVFIGYRREDSIAYAGRIYDHLASHFGKNAVFMDVDTIEPGLDFVDVLQDRVKSCDALVLIIGKHWLTATDEKGRRRLDDPEDLVRVEVAAALDRKVRVIPVLVGGAHMPSAQELPEPLTRLARRNALEISDLAFQQGVIRLIEVLDTTVGPDKTPAKVETTSIPATKAESQSQPARVMPLWRRFLLLYKLHSVVGGLFRLLFYGAAFITGAGTVAAFSGEFRSDADVAIYVVFILLTVLCWSGATWLGWRAARLHARR